MFSPPRGRTRRSARVGDMAPGRGRVRVLISWLVVVFFVPPVLPVTTRQAASLQRASAVECPPGSGACSVDLSAMREARGGGLQVISSSLPSQGEASSKWDTGHAPGAGRANFWGEKGGVESEIVVRRAGLASKRAKHPRRPGNAPANAVPLPQVSLACMLILPPSDVPTHLDCPRSRRWCLLSFALHP